MLTEIIRSTIATEPDMSIVAGNVDMSIFEGNVEGTAALGVYTRRRRIDVVIFVSGDENFADDKIFGLLRANPRLSLLAMDGRRDEGTLHHLVPAHDAIGRLAHASLTAAIRAGAALRPV
jgi:hypothetical protein